MTITNEQRQTAIAYLGTCIPLSLHYAAACAFKPKQMTMVQFDRLYCYSYEFEEFCTITYNHLPNEWQSIVRAIVELTKDTWPLAPAVFESLRFKFEMQHIRCLYEKPSDTVMLIPFTAFGG